MPRHHFTSIFAAGLLATLIIFYFPWLSGIQSFYVTDITNHFEPTLNLLSEYWRQGQIQLWNPYAHCGQPQIAIPQPNLFYPPNWIFAFLPFNPSLALNLVGHQFIAGLGNYLLVASLGWGFFPAAIAGVIAALSAYMFSLSTNYTLAASAAWLPLIVWSLRSMKSRGDFAYFSIATVGTAMMVLAGRPEIFAPALVVLAGYIVFSAVQSKHFSVLQAVALFLGIMLAAPFILPTLEWQALSPRAQGLVAKEVLVWSANWYDFLCMILPQPLGDLLVNPDKFLNLAASRPGYPPYLLAFVGPVVIALAFLGIFDLSFSAGLVMSVLTIVFIVFAAGDNLPIAPYLVSQFPKLAILRFPVKLLFFPIWFLSIFAARGLYLVREQRVSKGVLIGNLIFWLLLGILGLILPIYQTTVGIASAQSGSAAVFLAYQFICQSLVLMSFLSAMIIGIVLLSRADKISKNAVAYIALVSTYLLLMIHAYSFSYHFGKQDFFDNDSTYIEKKLASLGEDCHKLVSRQARIVTLYFSGLLMPNKLLAGGDPHWPASYYQYGRQILTPSTHFDRKLYSSFGYEGAETADYRKLFVETFNKSHLAAGQIAKVSDVDKPFYRFCQVTSTNYVLGMIDRLVRGRFVESAKLDPNYFQLLDEDRTWNIRIYKVNKPLPRIYMSYDWKEVEPETAIDAIINADRRDFDPEVATLIRCPGSKIATPSKGKGDWHAEFLENSANKIRIKVQTSLPGLFVLTDHYYPGWVATVDGKPETICRANGVLRGVFLAAGQHTIEFRYEPESLKFGYLISAFAALTFLFVTGFLFLRRRV